MTDISINRTMPNSSQVEECVLGALMTDSKCLSDYFSTSKSKLLFYDEKHRIVFQTIKELYDSHKPVDLVTVSESLKSQRKLKEVGGDGFLISLTQKVSSSAHLDYHHRLLQQHFIKREIIASAWKNIGLAHSTDSDALELLKVWEMAFLSVCELTVNQKSSAKFSDIMRQITSRVEMLSNSSTRLLGCTSGIHKIDNFTGGFKPGEFIVTAGRPSMGKTARVLKTALENGKENVPVGIISLEMSALSLATRIFAMDSKFSLNQLTNSGLSAPSEFVTLLDDRDKIAKYPINIQDYCGSDIREISATFRHWQRKYKIGIAILDYLQLAGDKSKGQREQEVASVSRSLKLLAIELQIPIKAVSQLSRKVEERKDKRPQLSDLRESGAIEQDADIIEFIYRPDYYGIEDDELQTAGYNAIIDIVKNRNGEIAEVGVNWIPEKGLFIG